MKKNTGDFPLLIKIAFGKIFELYRNQLATGNEVTRAKAQQILDIAEKNPILIEGIATEKQMEKYKPEIDIIMGDLFSSLLENNEIKIAAIPFQEYYFKSSKRFEKIISDAGENNLPRLTNLEDDHYYIMGCSIILNIHYGYKIDFRRPFYYTIPDAKGITKSYRVFYNGDFIEVEKTAKAVDITPEDVNELLESFDDIKVWKEKFPPESWIFKGFVIATLFDVTSDVSISDFKTGLLDREVNRGSKSLDLEPLFQSIFNIKDLRIGFTDYNDENETFEQLLYKDICSFILNGEKAKNSKEALCNASFYTLFKKKEFYCVTDAEKYHKLYPENILYKKMVDQDLKSAIFASIFEGENIYGVLELVSPNVNELNTINANKLRDIMPFLINTVIRSKEQAENELELIIQEECTALHSSVHWKFRKEAKRYFMVQEEGNPAIFREIVFEDVHPLFGQIDIIGSSNARNEATKNDLKLQLEHILNILKKIYGQQELPIFEHFIFTVENNLKELADNLQVDSERRIMAFLKTEIIPMFDHLSKKNESLRTLLTAYNELIDPITGMIYQHRKDFDESVMMINKRLASLMDKKQVEAQLMFPHYYERFKTDGLEHNLYIGASINKQKQFHGIYLNNLRLWQLQIMCDMENSFYKFQDSLPTPLKVASMILVFNGSLALRFRMDEKRFDVDGTYNARYEVVKKRVDKANIKGTQERVTQPGKLTIIYSQKEDEMEYLKYILFLQHKNQLGKEVEIVDLEDLQGVTGLKAIRIGLKYSKAREIPREYYTYDDVVSEINS